MAKKMTRKEALAEARSRLRGRGPAGGVGMQNKIHRAKDGLRGYECGRAITWHVNRRDGWVVYLRDDRGYQNGDAEYHYRKEDALAALERMGNEEAR